MQVLGAVGRMRDDIAAMEQFEQKMKEVAKHYADKYKEANEVLELRNTEKATLLQENEKLEKTKSALEQQVQELSQEKEDLNDKVDKITAVNEFWVEKGA